VTFILMVIKIKYDAEKIVYRKCVNSLTGEKAFGIAQSAKQFITQNPQWKISIGEVIDRDLPMKQALDSMLAKYPSSEENLRKAANQDTNIDIPSIFRNTRPSLWCVWFLLCLPLFFRLFLFRGLA
jgi:hypothetical protein